MCSARVLVAPRGTNDRVEEHNLGTASVRVDGLDGMYQGEAGVVSSSAQHGPHKPEPS